MLCLTWIEKFAFNTLPLLQKAQINAQNVSFHEGVSWVNNKQNFPHTAIAEPC